MTSGLILCPPHIKNGAHRYNAFIRPSEVHQKASELRLKASQCGNSPVDEALAFIAYNIKYTSDRRKWARPDYWQFPRQTLISRSGDCEDMSFLLASLLISMGYKDVRTVYGEVLTRRGWQDHMWVEVRLNGEWHVLESTSGKRFPPSERGGRGYKAYIYVYPHSCDYIEPPRSQCSQPLAVPIFEIIGAVVGFALLVGLTALLLGRR